MGKEMNYARSLINIRRNDLVSLSKGRAVCTNIARTDLCGGCGVTFIPTATYRPTGLSLHAGLPTIIATAI